MFLVSDRSEKVRDNDGIMAQLRPMCQEGLERIHDALARAQSDSLATFESLGVQLTDEQLSSLRIHHHRVVARGLQLPPKLVLKLRPDDFPPDYMAGTAMTQVAARLAERVTAERGPMRIIWPREIIETLQGNPLARWAKQQPKNQGFYSRAIRSDLDLMRVACFERRKIELFGDGFPQHKERIENLLREFDRGAVSFLGRQAQIEEFAKNIVSESEIAPS